MKTLLAFAAIAGLLLSGAAVQAGSTNGNPPPAIPKPDTRPKPPPPNPLLTPPPPAPPSKPVPSPFNPGGMPIGR